ncbi:MAG TPA: hypothetical protein VEG39_10225 [Clostridia bacterium]|nr:hypothetical protein [Clostridia bacterium]
MANVSSVRLTIPKAASGGIIRSELVSSVLGNKKKLVYIHAGAGYGKTTLLSQIAVSCENTVWLTLDGENDVFTFIDTLSEAVKQSFSEYEFAVSEYLPFEGKENFITMLANAFIISIEKHAKDIMLIIEDLHTTQEPQIRSIVTSIIKYPPDNIRVCLSSREAPWQELIPLRIRGSILELTQKELAFTREETAQILGFNDDGVFNITEGWPIAIGSFRVLMENGVSLADIPVQGSEALYSYLLFECISRLSAEMVHFLRISAGFEELDAQMLDSVLRIKNSRMLLESLVSRNIFTIKTSSGQYRYHALFREYLLETGDKPGRLLMQHEAARYYLDIKQYPRPQYMRYFQMIRKCCGRLYCPVIRNILETAASANCAYGFLPLEIHPPCQTGRF